MSSTVREFPKVCAECGIQFLAWFNRQKWCSHQCSAKAHSGIHHHAWNNGRSSDHGYPTIRINGKKVRENRAVAERVLGKPLPSTCVVHHWDENIENNEPSNLVICENDAYHNLLHARMRRLRDTGSFELKRCLTCNEIKPITDFHKRRRAWDGTTEDCKPCAIARAAYYRNKTNQSYV